jgi:tetratricopeptide (TPR) repeat protein
LWVGRFDDVETIGQEILAIGARIAEPTALGTVTLQRGVVLRARGQYDVLEPIARAGVDRFPNLPIARAMLGVVYADLNREVDARVEFEQLAANDFRDLQRINALDPLLPWLAEVCAFLGDARRAEQLIGQLERYATRVIPFGPRVCFGPATYPLGLLAARFGRAADAVRYFEQAIECCAQMGGRPALATAQYALARVKCDRAGSRDLDEADALVRRALGLAQPLGMAALADKIARLQTEIAEARTAPHDEPSRARAVGDIARPAGGLPPKHEPDVPPEARGQRPRAGGRIVPFPSRRARHAGTAVPTSTAAPAANAGLLAAQRIFRRDGDYWTVGDAQGVLRFTDTKGFRYIAHLLRHPGRAFHVSELVAAEALAPTSPAAASVTLRDRIDDLRDQLDEALRFNDPERAGRLREQLDRVAQDFVAAGGRSKAEIERMRLNVTRAIKAVLKRLGRGNPSLGRDLATTIRTGTYCVYVPDPRLSLTWQLEAES